MNDHDLFEERRKHVDRLRDIFSLAGWPTVAQLEHLRTHRAELSFPTALACELGLDLRAIL